MRPETLERFFFLLFQALFSRHKAVFMGNLWKILLLVAPLVLSQGRGQSSIDVTDIDAKQTSQEMASPTEELPLLNSSRLRLGSHIAKFDQTLVDAASHWLPGRLKCPEGSDNQSIVRISPYFRTSNSGDTLHYNPQVRGHLDLPGFKEKLEMHFGGLDEDLNSDLTDYPKKHLFKNVVQSRFWTKADIGFRYDHGIATRLRGKVGVTVKSERTNNTLEQQAYWRSDKGFGGITRFKTLYRLTENTRLHMQVANRWEENMPGVELLEVFGWYRDLPDYERFGARFIIREYVSGITDKDSVEFRSYYRMQLWNDSTFALVEPGVSFREDRDYEAAAVLVLRLDLFFGAVNDENIGNFYSRP